MQYYYFDNVNFNKYLYVNKSMGISKKVYWKILNPLDLILFIKCNIINLDYVRRRK